MGEGGKVSQPRRGGRKKGGEGLYHISSIEGRSTHTKISRGPPLLDRQGKKKKATIRSPDNTLRKRKGEWLRVFPEKRKKKKGERGGIFPATSVQGGGKKNTKKKEKELSFTEKKKKRKGRAGGPARGMTVKEGKAGAPSGKEKRLPLSYFGKKGEGEERR